VVPDDQLDAVIKEMTETIAGNAPLTVKCAKLVVGEVLKDADKRDVAATERARRGLLQERRLQGRPGRLHGEAQAEIHRRVSFFWYL
jgi:hypothetical protein